MCIVFTHCWWIGYPGCTGCGRRIRTVEGDIVHLNNCPVVYAESWDEEMPKYLHDRFRQLKKLEDSGKLVTLVNVGPSGKPSARTNSTWICEHVTNELNSWRPRGFPEGVNEMYLPSHKKPGDDEECCLPE